MTETRTPASGVSCAAPRYAKMDGHSGLEIYMPSSTIRNTVLTVASALVLAIALTGCSSGAVDTGPALVADAGAVTPSPTSTASAAAKAAEKAAAEQAAAAEEAAEAAAAAAAKKAADEAAAQKAVQERAQRAAAEAAAADAKAAADAAAAQAAADAQAQVAAAQPASTFFANCDAARAAGAAPVHVGDPGYSRKLDRDGDGVGCE